MADPVALEESEELQRSLTRGQTSSTQHRIDVHAVGPDGRAARYQVHILHDEDGLPIERDAADLPADYSDSRATRVDDSMYPEEPIFPRYGEHLQEEVCGTGQVLAGDEDSSDMLFPPGRSQSSSMSTGDEVRSAGTFESTICFQDCLDAARANRACPWPQESLGFAFDVDPDHSDEAVHTYLAWAKFGDTLPFDELAKLSPDVQRCRYEGLRGLAHLGSDLLPLITAQRDDKSRELAQLRLELEEVRVRERNIINLLAQIERLAAGVHVLVPT